MFVDLVAIFPNLARGFSRTSLPTIDYNCLGWALGDDKNWWEPDKDGWLHWPATLKRTYDIASYISACRLHNYQQCADGAAEVGFDKICMYTLGGKFTHIAKQLPNGRWSSKLGELDDIAHDLNAFDGTHYGNPTYFFKRPNP